MSDDRSGKTPDSGPPRIASDSLAKPLAKRFYSEAGVAGADSCEVQLDGRAVRTPKKHKLVAPTRDLAVAIAAEWQAQGANIDPATMPLTRFANTAIDAVAGALDAVAADIAAYAASDLLLYRAEGPDKLTQLQARHWDSVLAWAARELDAPFTTAVGVMPIAQPTAAISAIAAALEPHEAFRLTALHVLTTLTGSAILALAHAQGALDADATWAAAHVDEDYQISLWGEDAEAAARRSARRAEFDAASRMLTLLP